jgi:hypothetical protein
MGLIGGIAAPPKVHPHVATIGPIQVRKRLRERRDERLKAANGQRPLLAVTGIAPVPEGGPLSRTPNSRKLPLGWGAICGISVKAPPEWIILEGGLVFGRFCAKSLIVFVLLAAATAARAQQPPPQPFGVFAKVDVDSAANQSCTDPAIVHQCLQNIYTNVLSNKAISGLTIGLDWNTLSKTEMIRFPSGLVSYVFGGYDWSWLDDAFTVAGPQGLPVQLILTPGFASPLWVLDYLVPCDTLFTTGSAPPDCGSLQFSTYPGQSHTSGTILPLPWPSSSTYASWYLDQWTKFLGDLNGHVQQSQYAASLVAISVAGPTSASSEIIMPTAADGATLAIDSGEDVDAAWNRVIRNAFGTVFTENETYTDQPFIDAWSQTVQAYQNAFNGPTLILVPDRGDKLPVYCFGQFCVNSVNPQERDKKLFYTICSEFNPGSYAVSCEAKARILANFAAAQSDKNRQAIEVGGMSASSPLAQGDIGVPAVKCFATSSCLELLDLKETASFLGGAAFDYEATAKNDSLKQQLGCPTIPEKHSCKHLSPELIAFNVFAVFFDSTQGEDQEFINTVNSEILDAAGSNSPRYNTYKPDVLRIQYVDVSYQDVLYANEHECPSKRNHYISWKSMQDVLNKANYYLHTINSRVTSSLSCF